MTTYAIPVVDDVVDGVVGVVEDNIIFDLPIIGTLLKQAVELALRAAAVFAVALTLGGGLYYMWPSVAALAPRHLSTISGGYWSYVGLVLALYMVVVVYNFVRGQRRADVLHANTRSNALEALSEPGVLIMLYWLVTAHIA